ncbi:hypothetical protein [uncultured Lutibacter sp.]|uniref:hypothetical protein n=1 Tax=uncultured Lutibacter sp. TaxID=437739 RepID=UPI0026285100|nr:hypothetical protein [uncultured Lutibacter sp.]
MNKKVSLFCFTIFVFTLFGCNNNDEPITPSPYCYVSADYHFSGYVNGISKSFVSNSKNYQEYVGSEMLGGEEPIGRFVVGINTWPLNIGDEAIYIRTPKVNLKDADEVASLFPRGELSLEQRKDFKLLYETILDVNNYQSERFEGKFDEDSTIEICKIEKIYSSNGYTNYKVSMIFNCKLYSVGLNGESKGEIKNGEITGLISVPY